MIVKRAQRIQEAKVKLRELEPQWKHWKKLYEDAQSDLHAAERSYDIGERVQVTETCKRGCCVEHQYEGNVSAKTHNGMYCVKSTDGHVYEYVYDGDMKRP